MTSPRAKRRAVLIFNPTSGRQVAHRAVPKLIDVLSSRFDTEPLPTASPGDATRLAREHAAAADIDVAFALGGDGTLREVAKGLIGSSVALGPLPAGTANVLAYTLRLPRRSLAAARALTRGEVREMDVGMAGHEPFLMMASAGLDAAVMAHQNPVWKRRIGTAAIMGSGLGRWWSYPYSDLSVRVNGHAQTASFVALCNIPHYGGPFRLAPAADIQDGRLDLVAFRGRGRFSTLGFGASMILGRHRGRADVVSESVEEVELLGPLPYGLQVDGDVLPIEPPVRIRVAPNALRILTPGRL